MNERTKIAVAGAGSIGAYVGGALAVAGRNVMLFGRPRIVEAAANGIRLTDHEGRDQTVTMPATIDPARAFEDAGIILLTVKCGQTADMAELIERYAPREAIVVSLQNGVDNISRISVASLGSKRTALPGVVGFNVVQTGDEALRFHRATAGDIIVPAGHSLAVLLSAEGYTLREERDMQSILWGKLLLNLNNALNALSGLPLAEQLSDRAWRNLIADQMDEALAVTSAAGIKPAALAGVPPSYLPTILRLPNWLFKRVARRMLTIDPEARSSMLEDIERGRPTEVDEFQGAVRGLGTAYDIKTPLSAHLIELVRAAEQEGKGSPRLSPQRVRI